MMTMRATLTMKMTLKTALKSLLLALCGLAAAQTQALAQGRFRLADPAALGSGGGWAVDPRLGTLTMGLPVAAVDGELPIPLALRVNGSFKSSTTFFYEWIPEIKRWVLDYTTANHRPAYGTVHFGYIADAASYNGATESKVYALEDGTQFREEDWLAFTAWNATFTLPQDFGFLAKAPSAVKISNTGTHAWYMATPAELGAAWQAKAASLMPAGHGAAPTSYLVLMDKDKARVMAYLAAFKAYVPILWVDRFGHSVGFQWTRTTAALPPGVTAIHAVVAMNARNKGVQLQWADFTSGDSEQDLLRADFIGLEAPAILLRGYPGLSAQKPAGFAQTAVDFEALVPPGCAGPVGRPTTVRIGAAGDLAAPSWQASAPRSLPAAGSTLPTADPLQWTFGYEANHAALASILDPMGVTTTFTLAGGTNVPPTLTNPGAVRRGGLQVFGVTRAGSVDGTTTLTRDWARTTNANGAPTVVMKETYGALDSAPRSVELVYAAPSTGMAYGNGALTERILRDAAGIQMERTLYTLYGSGLDGTYTDISGYTVERAGEPLRVITRSTANKGTQLIAESQAWDPNGVTILGGNITQVSTANTFEDHRDKLELGRLTSTTTTRYDDSGSSTGPALAPAATSKVEYLANGRVWKSYREAEGGRIGESLSWDGEGRLAFRKPYDGETPSGAQPLPAERTESIAYDPASGLPVEVATAYLDGQGGMPVLKRTISGWDAQGRPTTQVDERGLSATGAFDLRGRPTSMQRGTDPALAFGYSGERIRTVTQNGVTTTETRDGFGRVTSVKKAFPAGITPEYMETTTEYDNLGRPVTVRQITGPSANAPQFTEYDGLDRPTHILNPAGNVVDYAYAADGRFAMVTQKTYPSGTGGPPLVTTIWKDGFGQVVKTQAPNGDLTTTTFDGLGNPLKVTLASKVINTDQNRTFTYDGFGRMLTRSEPETGTTTFSGHTHEGQPTTVVESKGGDGTWRNRSLQFDGLGRLLRQSNVVTGEYVSWTYAGADLASMETKNADGTIVRQSFRYAGPGKRLDQESTTFGATTWTVGYGFDALNRVNSLAYPSGRIVGYTFDAAGRVTSVTNNGAPVVGNVSFNAWGQREKLTFGSGAYSHWTTKDQGTHLDEWNISYTANTAPGGLSDPGTPRKYMYDEAERLSMAGEWSLTHDKRDRILAASAPALGVDTADFDHDAYGNNIKNLTTGAASAIVNNFNFAPQLGNQIPSLTAAGQTTGWVYAPNGEASSISRKADGAAQGVTWDGLGRLSRVLESGATTTTYAPSGLRVALDVASDPTKGRKYAYTAGGQLLGEYGGVATASEVHAGQKAVRMHHVGNQGWSGFSRSLGRFQAGDTVTATAWFKAQPGVYGEVFLGDVAGADPYDNANHTYIQGNGGWQSITLSWTMRHDDDMWVYIYGNQWTPTGYGTATDVDGPAVTWDDVAVSSPWRGTLVSDGFEGGIPAEWALNGTPYDLVTVGQPDSNQWRRDVIYLGGEAIAEVDASGVHELHNDHLGSPRIITRGADGKIEGKQAFAAYGERILSEGAYVPLTGYTGHVQQDPTGLIYMRGRYYSPAWHVFLNSDQGVDPNSWNQRAYVGGSPFMATDPSGLKIALSCDGNALVQTEYGDDGKIKERKIIGFCNGNGQISVSNGNGGVTTYEYYFGSWVDTSHSKLDEYGRQINQLYTWYSDGTLKPEGEVVNFGDYISYTFGGAYIMGAQLSVTRDRNGEWYVTPAWVFLGIGAKGGTASVGHITEGTPSGLLTGLGFNASAGGGFGPLQLGAGVNASMGGQAFELTRPAPSTMGGFGGWITFSFGYGFHIGRL